MNPGDLQIARESDGQTNGHAYGGKETRHSVGVFLICQLPGQPDPKICAQLNVSTISI
jgi:hypothetical protein